MVLPPRPHDVKNVFVIAVASLINLSLQAKNLRRMQRTNSQDERVSLRVEGERTPERLQIAADAAARSGDLQTTVEYANGTRQTIQLWDQFRVWDPGD